MSELLDTMLRFERGDLPSPEAEAVRARLARDEDARAWLEWIKALRRTSDAGVLADAAASAAPPDPIEIAALAEGGLPADRARKVRAALVECADGYAMLEAALEEARAAVRPGLAELDRRPSRWRLRVWVAAAAALLAIVSVWRLAGESSIDVTALARREALPVSSLRSGEDPVERGLRAYGSADYTTAAAELSAVTALDPANCRPWLYLGSSLLLLGRDEDAAVALERAAATCTGAFANEARWQLAQARLAANDSARAVVLLESLGETNRADDARALLESLRTR